MFFFEGKVFLYYALCLAAIPIICCLLFGFGKPQRIWHALWLSIILFFALTAVFFPYIYQDIWNNSYDMTSVLWLKFFIPAQFIASFFITAIAYQIKKRRKPQEQQ